MNEKSPRNIKADVIRGFAIISVVVGHCIQQGNGLEYYNNSQYWFNKLYQFIYSFHMPLFMILAGWFAYYSLKKLEGKRTEQWKFLIGRIALYVFPIFFWTLFEFVRGYITNLRLGNENAPFADLAIQFVNYFITNIWFLWAITLCLIVAFIMHLYLKDNIFIYLLMFLGMFVISDNYNLGVYKFLLPFYLIAFYTNMYKEALLATNAGKKISKLYSEKSWIIIILAGIIFIILFLFYNDMTFIYRSGYRISRATLFSQTVLDMYRMLIGFAGSIFFILLIGKIVDISAAYKWPVLSLFGKNSLGVYILQGYYILLVLTKYTNNLQPHWWIVLIESIMVCAASLVSVIILDRVPVARCVVGRKPFRGQH